MSLKTCIDTICQKAQDIVALKNTVQGYVTTSGQAATTATEAADDAVMAKDAILNASDSIVIVTTGFTYVATDGQSVFTGADSNGTNLSINTESVEAFVDGTRVSIVLATPTEVTLASGATLGSMVVINTDRVEFEEA